MPKVKDILGKLKSWKKSTVRIMKEIDKELDSKITRRLQKEKAKI